MKYVSEKLNSVLKENLHVIKFIITTDFIFNSNECFLGQLKFIKHSVRATRTDERLNGFMILRCKKFLAETMDLLSPLNNWNQLKNSKIKTLTK